MNKLLEKFTNKVTKITNFTIIYQDEINIVLSVPIFIEVEVLYNMYLSCNPRVIPQQRQFQVVALFTTNIKNTLAIEYKSKGILVEPLTASGSKKTVDEIREGVPEMLKLHYEGKKERK